MSVQVLEAGPARELLLQRSGLTDTEANRAGAEALARELGYLPLALEVAAAHIREERHTLEEYLALCTDPQTRRRAELLAGQVARGTRYPAAVAAVWLITIGRLGPRARNILRMLAFLAPDPLPRDVLHQGADLLEAADTNEVNEALAELQRYALIGPTDADGPVTIHWLLQAVQEDELEAGERRKWVDRAVQLMGRAFPWARYDDWQTCEALLPHAATCSGHARRYEVLTSEAASLSLRVGHCLLEQGRVSEAREPLELAVQAFERLLTADPNHADWQRDLSVSHNQLGDVRRAQGDLPGARAAYEAGLGLAERLAAADPGNISLQRDLSVSHSKLGYVRAAQGDLPGALREYEADLAIARRHAAADPGHAPWQRDLSISYERLGEVRVAQGDLPGAEAACEAALTIRERLAAADPDNAARQRELSVSHEKLGDVRVAQGDLPAAQVAYEAALTISARLAADPDNAAAQSDLSVSENKLGDVQLAQGDLPGARAAFEAALAIRERLATADPGNAEWQRGVAISHNKLGDVQAAQGDWPGALRHYEADLAIAERLAAADPGNAAAHRDLFVSYWRMASIAERTGSQALTWWRRAYDTLAGMKAQGMHLSPEDDSFLEQLRGKAGGGAE